MAQLHDSDADSLPEVHTPPDAMEVSDADSFPPEIDDEVVCVMMSGDTRLTLRYDHISSIGWLRSKVFGAWGTRFDIESATQVRLLHHGDLLSNDCTKLCDKLSGTQGGTREDIVQVILTRRESQKSHMFYGGSRKEKVRWEYAPSSSS